MVVVLGLVSTSMAVCVNLSDVTANASMSAGCVVAAIEWSSKFFKFELKWQ